VREAVIENPVINSAFVEPARHFKFDDDGIPRRSRSTWGVLPHGAT